MNKKFSIFVSSLVSIATSLCVSSYYWSNQLKLRDLQHSSLEKLNALAAYQGYVEVSKLIGKGDLVSAKCQVDLRSSHNFDKLKECQADRQCDDLIKQTVGKSVADLLDEKSTGLQYYQVGKICR